MTKQAKASCTLCHYVFEHDNSWFCNVLSQVDQDVDQDMIRSNRKSRDFGTWTWPRFVSNRFGRFQGHLDQLRIETLEDGCILHRTCELMWTWYLEKAIFFVMEQAMFKRPSNIFIGALILQYSWKLHTTDSVAASCLMWVNPRPWMGRRWNKHKLSKEV